MEPTTTAPDLASELLVAEPQHSEHAERRTAQRKRARVRMLRRVLLGALLIAATVATVLALRPRPVPIDAARVARGPLEVVIEESGRTRVKDRFLVSAPVAGSLSRLSLEPGDVVAAGDALAEIAPAQSTLLDERTRAEAEGRLGAALSALGQARAQQARAATAQQLAEQELVRARALGATGSVPEQTLEQADFLARMRSVELSSAVFASKVAAEEVRIARVTLGERGSARADRHVDVLAPASGRVLRVEHQSAGVVQAGMPLLEVGDPAALEVVVDLLTTDAVHVRPGTHVLVQGWGGDRPLRGRVRRVEPSALTRLSALGVEEQRVNVLIALTEPDLEQAALGDGYHVEVQIVLWRGEDVLKAPQGAVFRHGSDWAAYRVRDGKVKRVPVKLGHRGETEVEILAGLAAGDEVAVHPGDRVKDGVTVEAR